MIVQAATVTRFYRDVINRIARSWRDDDQGLYIHFEFELGYSDRA